MDTPSLSPAGVSSPSPPPLDTRLTDQLTELTGPEKRRREVEQSKRKRYAGESFNWSIM